MIARKASGIVATGKLEPNIARWMLFIRQKRMEKAVLEHGSAINTPRMGDVI